ncbi:response regulator transcription factor [Aquimonas voraii]|uniref:DNA-binding response regulator, OmpR family, contains REC and winged-helix (WHTH) domain n=1 Tax=Aquimonas voraii TaxID=265719 RepID=A0A1G6XE25_9GAMM|nr:response regulator transcription factor [Aquimonas voraii]SDD75555.1 DNA-binding response regulator, OmpR family, contains REC and winged-helix (wHTH) domain [Aquimonas voraii]
MKILIVEDQRDLAANLWEFLEARGHCIDHAGDGLQGLRMAETGDFDALVLDLELPRLDGLELCERLRARGHAVPVLMLSARGDLHDRLAGFRRGADDYLPKPFALLELEARLLSLHRRRNSGGPLSAGELSFDPHGGGFSRAGRRLALSALQARLLEALLRASPAVVDSARLAEQVWGAQTPGIDALHSLMAALRAVLDRPFDRPLIRTVYGLGYRLVGDGDVGESMANASDSSALSAGSGSLACTAPSMKARAGSSHSGLRL